MIDYKTRYRELLEFTYGPTFYNLRWMQPGEAQVADMMRQNLLEAIGDKARFICKGNKLVYGELSPGCEHCAARTWSCLFINNKCNARCFFCPSEQNEAEPPSTVMLYFRRPESYAAYCEKLGITGASISGGEPFLTPKRTIAFLQTCKKKLGDDFYFWLYTNGALAKPELLQAVADAGLNEIRFDIAAWQYNLKMIQRAVGVIPNVTVETPAIPEDLPLMKQALVDLSEMGVQYVNLHQMRMTTYNCQNLSERGYCLTEGPHPAVVESELAALELMLFAAENELPIGINYCSFVYRNRFQRAAVQTQAAGFCANKWETITATGLIRSLAVPASGEQAERLINKMSEAQIQEWVYVKEENKMYLTLAAYAALNEPLPAELTYYKAALADIPKGESANSGAAEINLDKHKTIQCIRTEQFRCSLMPEDVARLAEIANAEDKDEQPPERIKPAVIKLSQDTFAGNMETEGISETAAIWDEIEFSEHMEHGLQKY